MANEVRILTSLSILKGSLDYQSRPSSFTGSITGSKGVVPGAITVATGGTAISLSQLTTPAYCRIQNLDSTNYVEYGVYDTGVFYQLGELLPGESYILRLSRNLANRLYCKANTASVVVLIEAFET